MSIFYSASVRVLYFLCGQNWFRNLGTKRKRHAAMVERFLQQTNFPVGAWPEIIRNSLLANLIEELWENRLLVVAPVVVEGLEYAQRAQASKTGIIFVRFHQKFGGAKTSAPLSNWLERQSFRPQFNVADRRHISAEMPEAFSNAQDLIQAQHILRKGGIIQIVPDGQHGSKGIQRDFFKHQRTFRTGFAELALATQAQVIPICLQLKANGAVTIKISQPLRRSSEMTRDEQIASLVDQYVSALDEFWKTYPYMIVYHYMKKHMKGSKSNTASD